MSSPRPKRTYDHRLVRLVQETGDATIATDLGVPRSTVASWLRRTPAAVVSAPGMDASARDLRFKVGTESGHSSWIGVTGQRFTYRETWHCVPGRARRRDAWPIVRAGLRWHFARMTYQDIPTVLDLTQASAQTPIRQHDRLVGEGTDYSATASEWADGCRASLAPIP